MAIPIPSVTVDSYAGEVENAGGHTVWRVDIFVPQCPEPVLAWAILLTAEGEVEVIIDVQGAVVIESLDDLDTAFGYVQSNVVITEYATADEYGEYDGSGIPIGYRPGIHAFLTPDPDTVDTLLFERRVKWNIDDDSVLPPPTT